MAGMNGMNTSVVIVDAPSVLRTSVARALSRDVVANLARLTSILESSPAATPANPLGADQV